MRSRKMAERVPRSRISSRGIFERISKFGEGLVDSSMMETKEALEVGGAGHLWDSNAPFTEQRAILEDQGDRCERRCRDRRSR